MKQGLPRALGATGLFGKAFAQIPLAETLDALSRKIMADHGFTKTFKRESPVTPKGARSQKTEGPKVCFGLKISKKSDFPARFQFQKRGGFRLCRKNFKF